MKTKTIRKNNKQGISLIVLVITIIVMVILAGAIILTLNNSGIIGKASEAVEETNLATVKEVAILAWAEAYLENKEDPSVDIVERTKEKIRAQGYTVEGQGGEVTINGYNMSITITGVEITTVAISEAQDRVLSYTQNTAVLDDYGNKILVPAGFKITTDASNVTQGIVIEDCTNAVTQGSQFVWIPVGTVKIDARGTTIENPLERYSGLDDLKHGSSEIEINYLKYAVNTEETAAFVSSVGSNGGYYIGRYEARTAEDQRGSADKGVTATDAVTCTATDYLYNYVKYVDALRLSKEMYTGTTFSSNLVNSYAWDTALEYFETVTNSKNYSETASINQGSEDGKVNFCWKGTVGTANEDKICNVYDMASNSYEWSTEIHIENDGTSGEIGVVRGGVYSETDRYAGTRYLCEYDTEGYHTQTFRVVLYM